MAREILTDEPDGSGSRHEEKFVLLKWKGAMTSYGNTSYISTWTQDTPVCEDWEGVYCTDGRVFRLDLPGQGITGSLPDDLTVLARLEHLSIKLNRLHGRAIPETWTSFVHLQMIDASHNELEGSLPDNLGLIGRLNTLHLQNNRLQGRLPHNLGALEYLSVAANNIAGTLPATWGTFLGLKSIKLENNELAGPLPEQWSALEDLKFMQMQDNFLTGTMPESWAAGMRSMKFMELYNNYLDTAQLAQIEASMKSSDWVLLPQRHDSTKPPPEFSMDKNSLAPRLQADEGGPSEKELERLFSPLPPGHTPKVVHRGISSPVLMSIVISITAVITFCIVCLLIFFVVRTVRRSLAETKALVMTNLADEVGGQFDWHRGELQRKDVAGDLSRTSLLAGEKVHLGADRTAGIVKRLSPQMSPNGTDVCVELSGMQRPNTRSLRSSGQGLYNSWSSNGMHAIPVVPQPEMQQGANSDTASELIFGISSWKEGKD